MEGFKVERRRGGEAERRTGGGRRRRDERWMIHVRRRKKEETQERTLNPIGKSVNTLAERGTTGKASLEQGSWVERVNKSS